MGSTNFNFVGQDRQFGFRHDGMLHQLLRVIRARETTQDQTAILANELEIADPAAQPFLHAIFQLIETALRSGQGLRENVWVHGCSLPMSLGANVGTGTMIVSDNAGALGARARGWLPGNSGF